MNVALARRKAALPAAPQVIVVRADDDELLLQLRVCAFEYADDVCGRRFAAREIGRQSERDVLQQGGEILARRLRTCLCVWLYVRLRVERAFECLEADGRCGRGLDCAARNLARDDDDGQTSIACRVVFKL